jgi:hypothetical protein
METMNKQTITLFPIECDNSECKNYNKCSQGSGHINYKPDDSKMLYPDIITTRDYEVICINYNKDGGSNG